LSKCPHCHGFGYVQVYQTTVMRVFCDCEAGDDRIQELREALMEEGLDPDSPDYLWTRREEVMRRKSDAYNN